MARRRSVLLGIATTLLTFGAVADAFDVTGTWEGTYKCKGSYAGEKDSYADALVAKITQSGVAVGADITFDGDLFRYSGVAVANAAKPDKGDLGIVICGSDDDLTAGIYDELGRLSVTTKPSKGTGSIKGSSFYTRTNPGGAYTCKWSLKRTDPADPAVGVGCP